MLIRLRVTNFKNLVDADVRFGPFTCIAGPNAVGKSNLFDAIRFLSSLADHTLLDAALAVRGEGKSANVKSLFHRVGDSYADQMDFTADMIVPHEGVDDLGQRATASTTFLRYQVSLGYRTDTALPGIGSLELLSENLERIKIGDASREVLFPNDVSKWRASVLHGRRTTPFISTVRGSGSGIIKLSQDRSGGRPRSILAASLPRTVLSTVNASESPTALLARREMQSWRLMQLEPSALREPDSFTTPPGLGTDGSGLPATLYHLARSHDRDLGSGHSGSIYEQVALRLAGLID
ncbi:MAG: AAA family ATPase, partial [Chloroflexi bacterium]|nr:AAA family ATPase [Chloroflexota bacterium]